MQLQILEAYGPAALLIAGLLTVARLLIARGFRLSFKAEVPRRAIRLRRLVGMRCADLRTVTTSATSHSRRRA